MADNGGSNWGFDDAGGRGGGSPLDPLREVLEPLRGKGGLIAALVAAAFVLAAGLQTFFQVEPEEEAVVLRFGKPIPGSFGPGLHTRIPFVDAVYKVPVLRQHRLEFGFRSQPGVVTRVTEEGYAAESLMLTGDLMLVHVRWSLVYKIEDIRAWLFEIKDHEQTIRDISMGIMRQVLGDYSLVEVLTTKQLEIASLAEQATQFALRDRVPTGVVITEVAIKSADVPAEARQAFDDLTRTLAKVQGELAEAKAEQDNAIGEAWRQRSETIGRAEKQLAQVVENAHGEAAAFLAKLDEYNQAPEITRQWMYLKTMTQVLRGLDEKIVVEDGGGSGVVKHLPLRDFMTVQGGAK